MSDFRVIVTGSRDHPCEDDIWEALAMILAENCDSGDTFTVVHGACPTGADAHAASWVRLPFDGSGITIIEERYPAEWRLFGKAAGPRRNAEMVALGADLVLAFPLEGPQNRSRGTYDCIKRATEARIPVEIQTPSLMPRFTFEDVAEAVEAVRDE